MSDQTPYSSYPDGPQWQNQAQGGYPPASGPYTPPPYGQPQGASYPPQQPYAPVQYQQSGYSAQPVYVATPVSEPGAGMAVTSLVLGILSLVFCWAFFLWFIEIPLAVLGIIMGAMGRRAISRRGMAIAGLVCSIVGLSLFLVIWIILAAAVHSI